MTKRRLTITAVPVVAAAVAAVLMLSGTRGGGPAGGASAREEDAAAPSAESIYTAMCEHRILTYTCDACRFETGVVKITPDLLAGAAGDSGLIRLEIVETRKVERRIEATGEIRLNENAAVHIAPRVRGVVRAGSVDVGAFVSRGTVLFEIESAELGEALGAWSKSRTMTELSRRNYEREQTLFAQKISSEAEVIEARMTYEEHRADFEVARNALRVFGLTDRDLDALAADEQAGRVGRLPFRAPISGVVLEKHAAVGEMVEPGSDVMLLADLSTVWVWLDIFERDLPAMIERRGDGTVPVEIETQAFPGRAFAGVVDLVESKMNEETRTVKARAAIANRSGLLRPGMFCTAAILLRGEGEALMVPRAAVLGDAGESFVFKHFRERYFIRRAVRTGREAGGFVEVAEGLAPGDTIVTAGAFLLKSDVLREKMGAGCAD